MKVLLPAQIIKGESPQCNKLFGCAKILSPPEPASRMLMPGPEDYRDSHPLFIPERGKKYGKVIKPALELLVFFSSGQHRSDCPVRRHIPCRSAGKEVIDMPAESDDPAALPYLLHKNFHIIKWNRIQVHW